MENLKNISHLILKYVVGIVVGVVVFIKMEISLYKKHHKQQTYHQLIRFRISTNGEMRRICLFLFCC
jgi:hypothetical protein